MKLALVCAVLFLGCTAVGTTKRAKISAPFLQISQKIRDLRIGGQSELATSLAELVQGKKTLELSASDELRGPAESAIRAWNRALGREIFSLKGKGSSIRLEQVASLADGDEQGSSNIRISNLGSEALYTGSILVSSLYEKRLLTHSEKVAVLVHELGHVLGLEDSNKGVMGEFDPLNLRLNPTESEVRAIKEFWSKA